MKGYRTFQKIWTRKGMFGLEETPPQTPPKTDPNPDYKVLYEQSQADLAKLREDTTKSYTGLQRTLQTEQDAKKKLEETLASVTGQLQTMTTSHGELNQKVTTLAEDVTKATSEATKLRLETARQKLIIKEFPALASFEAEGLIPNPPEALKADGTVDTEKLTSIFKTFAEKLDAITKSKQQEYRAGGSPPGPTNEQKPTEAAGFLKAANECLAKGDQAGFKSNYDKYIEASKKQQ